MQSLKKIKVKRGRDGKPSCSHLPITLAILRKLKAGWLESGDATFEAVMLWAASLTTLFSFCRSGEVMVENKSKYDPNTHLSFSDLAASALRPTRLEWAVKWCWVELAGKFLWMYGQPLLA